jgi:hypothetical protein
MSILDGLKTCRKGLHQYSSDLKRCPECHREAVRQWQEDNREYTREKAKERYYYNKEDIKEKNRERANTWRKQNPERKRKQDKEYYEKNKQKSLDNSRQWVKKNPEKSRQIKERWRKNNSEKIREIQNHWRKNNKYKCNARAAKRRALKKQAIAPWANLDMIKKIYAAATELTEKTGIPHEVDHIYPLQNKYMCGLHVETNLQILTLEENRSKSNRTWPGQLDCQKD